MTTPQRRGGMIQLQVAGVLQDAKGSFSYNLGHPMRSAIEGSSGIHGFSEKPQVAFIEGEITDRGALDLKALVALTDVTVTLELANGKIIVLRDAWFAAEGSGDTDEGAIKVRFESSGQAEEVA